MDGRPRFRWLFNDFRYLAAYLATYLAVYQFYEFRNLEIFFGWTKYLCEMTVIDQIVPAVSFGADMLTQLGESDGSGGFIFVFLGICGLFVYVVQMVV